MIPCDSFMECCLEFWSLWLAKAFVLVAHYVVINCPQVANSICSLEACALRLDMKFPLDLVEEVHKFIFASDKWCYL